MLACAAGSAAQSAGGQARGTGNSASTDKPKSTVSSEKRMSAKEAHDLFGEVDQILRFASKDTDLPIKREVKPHLTGRDEIEGYLKKNMAEDKDAKRLQRSELVLKKFGLLPRDFDLGKFLVGLLKEQIAGYYDPKTKVVNLLDWVDVAAQRPVLAHELTHALQDQSFKIDKWMRKGNVDLETKKNPTALDVQNDETSEVRQAVVEGQAMAVLVDYMLAPTGQTLQKSPEVAKALEDGMLVGTPDSIQFRNAPIYLREAMTFPYRYGLEFEAALLRAGGKEKAYRSVFKNPPRTTREIMEPATYLAGQHIAPLPLPDFKHIFKSYDRFDVGAIGEFDVGVLIDQYAGSDASRKLYPSWRGGYYYAARPKDDSAAVLGMLYVSRWASAESAEQFASIYAKYLPKRYLRVRDVIPDGDGKPAAGETSTHNSKTLPDISNIQKLTGSRTWLTESGSVFIDVRGDTVLVSESLDNAVTRELDEQVFHLDVH